MLVLETDVSAMCLVFSLCCLACELSNSLELSLLSELQYFQSAGPWGSITPLKRLYHTVLPWFFCSLWSPYTAQLRIVADRLVPLHIHFAMPSPGSHSPTEHPGRIRTAFHTVTGTSPMCCFLPAMYNPLFTQA